MTLTPTYENSNYQAYRRAFTLKLVFFRVVRM
jgi:hypothetical protein